MKKLDINPSGYYNYDEEFIKIIKEIYIRLTLIDAHTRMIINDELIPKDQFNKKYIEKFLRTSTEGIKLKTIITDGHHTYKEIIKKTRRQTSIMHISFNTQYNIWFKPHHTEKKQKNRNTYTTQREEKEQNRRTKKWTTT